MNFNKTLCFISLFTLGSVNYCFAQTPKAIEQCEQKSKHIEQLSACLDGIKNQADKELKTWTNNQVFVLKELMKSTGRSSALDIFRRSQRNFEQYRENNCRWQYLQISPASGASVAYKKCYIRLTKAKSQELANLNDSL